MGLEWRGPHWTHLIRLLHYAWIPTHYVNGDGSDQTLKKVFPYYGAPQTKPGVQYSILGMKKKNNIHFTLFQQKSRHKTRNMI